MKNRENLLLRVPYVVSMGLFAVGLLIAGDAVHDDMQAGFQRGLTTRIQVTVNEANSEFTPYDNEAVVLALERLRSNLEKLYDFFPSADIDKVMSYYNTALAAVSKDAIRRYKIPSFDIDLFSQQLQSLHDLTVLVRQLELKTNTIVQSQLIWGILIMLSGLLKALWDYTEQKQNKSPSSELVLGTYQRRG